MQIDQLLNKNRPLLIDGGLSNVLEGQGCDLNHKLWTAGIIDNNPEAIIEAHLAYLKAGAKCITTASYQASIRGLLEAGYSPEKAKQLIIKSVQLAEIAIENALKSGIIDFKPIIAASVGPYGAYLADGSEYRGDYGISDEELREFHSERIRILDLTEADLIACETIPCIQEARVLAGILANVVKPAWVSFSCKDEQHLSDGTKIKEAVSIFEKHPKVFAIGVNCTHPKYISGIIKRIKTADPQKKLIVYPNSGEAYNAKTKTWMQLSEPDSFVDMSEEWLNQGVDMIGGCCRIGPEHIRRMSKIILNS